MRMSEWGDHSYEYALIGNGKFSFVYALKLFVLGRDGLTHNMLENIHTYWMRRSACKIKCRGVCTVDMDNVCQQLEVCFFCF